MSFGGGDLLTDVPKGLGVFSPPPCCPMVEEAQKFSRPANGPRELPLHLTTGPLTNLHCWRKPAFFPFPHPILSVFSFPFCPFRFFGCFDFFVLRFLWLFAGRFFDPTISRQLFNEDLFFLLPLFFDSGIRNCLSVCTNG